LFAALDVLEGKVIGRCMQRHRRQEFIRFLNAIKAEIPVGKIIHVVLDNYATHKHPKVRAWLARHPRFVFHFTPKSCSWLNAVETLFSRLTRRRLKRGAFRSIVELQAAINRFLAETNADPKPFVWTAHPDRVIAAVQRGMQVLEPVTRIVDRLEITNAVGPIRSIEGPCFREKSRNVAYRLGYKCSRQFSQSLRSSRRA